MPPWNDRSIALAEGECWNVAKLIDEAPPADFAFRSLVLFGDEDCRDVLGVNPVLIELGALSRTWRPLGGTAIFVRRRAECRRSSMTFTAAGRAARRSASGG